MIGRGTSVNARARNSRVARASIASVLRRALLGVAAATLPVLWAVQPARAQTAVTRSDDAAPVPRGMARLRVVPSWSRFDTRFAGTPADGPSTVPLAAVLAADSLGVTQVPVLAPSEAALRTLTGDPAFRLSLGRSASVATSRIVTTAIVAEYGLTRRLTVGGVLPVVQTRTELFVTLNQDHALNANVGPNPARIPGTRPTETQ